MSNHLEFDDNLLEFYNVSDKLDYFHFSRERTAQDVTVNNEGNVLLDVCKANNLFMLNGGCGDDKSVGTLTFRNCSTIDYSIVSHEFLQFVDNFSVTELDPNFSDGHSVITTNLCFKCPKSHKRQLSRKQNRNMGKPKCNPKHADNFENNLDRNKIHELRNILEEASTNKAFQTEVCNSHL